MPKKVTCEYTRIPSETVIRTFHTPIDEPSRNEKGDYNVNMHSGNHVTYGVTEQVMETEVVTNKAIIRKHIEVFLSETLGTALLMFFGCMSCMSGFSTRPFDTMGASVSFGLIVGTIIQVFGHMSNAHLNPAVSVSFFMLGDISIYLFGTYIVAEVIGANLGFGLLKALIPDDFDSNNTAMCNTVLHSGVSIYQALIIEFVGTSLLILLVCNSLDPISEKKQDSMAIKFAMIITLVSYVAGPFTGASINPARSLAPAIWNGVWANHWVYWVAPLAAGAIVPVMYQMIFRSREEHSEPVRRSSRTILTKLKF